MFHSGKQTLALEYFQRAESLARRSNDPQDLTSIYLARAVAQFAAGEARQAYRSLDTFNAVADVAGASRRRVRRARILCFNLGPTSWIGGATAFCRVQPAATGRRPVLQRGVALERARQPQLHARQALLRRGVRPRRGAHQARVPH